jgi:hypothetical protein
MGELPIMTSTRLKQAPFSLLKRRDGDEVEPQSALSLTNGDGKELRLNIIILTKAGGYKENYTKKEGKAPSFP